MSQNPKIKTRDVVADLGLRGIKVTPTLVYFVKSQMKKKKHRLKCEKAAELIRQSGGQNPLALIMRVKELARDLGGLKHLKQLVDALAE